MKVVWSTTLSVHPEAVQLEAELEAHETHLPSAHLLSSCRDVVVHQAVLEEVVDSPRCVVATPLVPVVLADLVELSLELEFVGFRGA